MQIQFNPYLSPLQHGSRTNLSVSINKVYSANVTILRTNERVTAMTCSNPPLPSPILSNCAMKWKNVTGSPFEFLFQDWGYRESFLQEPQAHLFVVTILFVALLWSELSSVLSPKFVTRSPTTYKNGLGHGKKTRLYQRKLEIPTRCSYTLENPMSERWGFIYIESHVTLRAKPDA